MKKIQENDEENNNHFDENQSDYSLKENKKNIFIKIIDWCKRKLFAPYLLLIYGLLIIISFPVFKHIIQTIKNDKLITKIKNDKSYNFYTLTSINKLTSANFFKTQNNEICIVASDNICFFDSNKYSLKCQKTKIYIPQGVSYKVSGIEMKNNLYLLVCGDLYTINNKTKKIVQIPLNYKLTPNSKLFQISTSELLIIDTYAIYIYNTEKNSLVKTDKSIKNKREDFNAININQNQILVIGGNTPTLRLHQNDSNKIYYENQIYNIEKKNINGDITIKKDNILTTLVNPKNTYEIFEILNNGNINQHTGNIDLNSKCVRLQSLPSGNIFILGYSDATIFDIKTKTLKKIKEDSISVNANSCIPIKLNNGNALFICDNKNNKDNNPFEKVVIKYDENQNEFKILTKLTCVLKNQYTFIQGKQLPDGNILLMDIVPKIVTLKDK